ncbi:hypothetical protein, partial [Xanthomonas citri]|uniref:M61 family metallopeptidase n=1 Tax=Xanthomonas citri TaxID=346 RepID=UPI001CBB1C57
KPLMQNGSVKSIAVTEKIATPSIAKGKNFLSMPMLLESIPGTLTDPTTLHASDDLGELPLLMTEDAPDPEQVRQERHWAPERATRGDITVTYLATPRVITPQTPPAPLNDTRTEGSGVYGATSLLLAVPEDGWPRKFKLTWDLTMMPAGSTSASSFGDGDSWTSYTKDQVESAYFMAGKIHRSPPSGTGNFTVYYLTPPKFELEAATRFTAATYDYAGKFFGDSSKPFRVFMRTTDRFQGGGGGGLQSFIFGNVKDQDRDPIEVRSLMAHEAIHNWISSFGEGYAGKWFVEGATEFYSITLPRRAGLSTAEEYLNSINAWARDYYTNPSRDMPDDQATKLFLSNINAQLLPYQRGPLYIAQVDARMRAASGGRRSVDELVRPMVRAIRDERASEKLWQQLVSDALGAQGIADYTAFKAGHLLDLPSNAFGECFKREAASYRDFSPGFRIEPDPDGTFKARFIRPDMAGSKAGLLDGDEILDRNVLKSAKKNAETVVSLKIRRNNAPMTLSLHPWGPEMSGFRWVRADVTDKSCSS